MAWKELWKNPAIFVLAFWYSFVTTIFQRFAGNRLLPLLPSSWRHISSSLFVHPHLPQLSPTLTLTLVLVYLTMILIVSPFSLGGLYGGAAGTLKGREATRGGLGYFRYAVNNFWRALGFVVLAMGFTVVLAGAVVAVVILAGMAARPIPVLSTILTLALLTFATALMLIWLYLLLYWIGSVFYGELAVWPAFVGALRWVVGHVLFSFRFMLLIVGLLVIFYLALQMVFMVPILGALVGLAAAGLFLPAFMAVVANLIYREADRFSV